MPRFRPSPGRGGYPSYGSQFSRFQSPQNLSSASSSVTRGWQIVTTITLLAVSIAAITALVGVGLTAFYLVENVQRLDDRIKVDRDTIAALESIIDIQNDTITQLSSELLILNGTMPSGNGTIFFDDTWLMVNGADNTKQFMFDASGIPTSYPSSRMSYAMPQDNGTLALIENIPSFANITFPSNTTANQTKFSEDDFAVYLSGDPSTELQFDLSLFTPGIDRVATWPNSSGEVVFTTGPQTFDDKTLTATNSVDDGALSDRVIKRIGNQWDLVSMGFGNQQNSTLEILTLRSSMNQSRFLNFRGSGGSASTAGWTGVIFSWFT